jgi:hypothetical protein
MEDLLALVPPVKRARGSRLYDFHGNRYLDLYRNSGRALLGHRGEKITLILKNEISKGLILPLPSIHKARLIKAMRKLLPGYEDFRVFSSIDNALSFLGAVLGETVREQEVADPVFGSGRGSRDVSYYRPLFDSNLDTEYAIPVLPFAVCQAPVVVARRGKFPVTDMAEEQVSPFVLAGAARSVFDLLAAREPAWLEKGLFENPNWFRKGLYFHAGFEARLYPDAFKRFLDQGVLLSPVYPGPSILPLEASEGEIKKISKLFAQIPGDLK